VRPGPDGKGTCVEALIPMALAPEQSGTGESAYAGEKLDA